MNKVSNKVSEVAKYIVNYPEITVDNLKLQKLLYYAQAVSLVINDKPLFNEPIEAWDYGPVVREIYDIYKKYNEEQIEKKRCRILIDPKSVEMIDIALGYYGNMTGSQLITLTHSETPWQVAYLRGRNSIITQKSIKDYYSKIYKYE